MPKAIKQRYYLQDIFRPKDLYFIDEVFTFGSDKKSDFVVPSESKHQILAQIEKRDESFHITVLDSRASVIVNSVPVTEARLSLRDRIRVAGRSFLFIKYEERNRTETYLTSGYPKWQTQLDRIDSMAESDLPVIIQGPSGTGKEMLAKIIHQYSKRKDGPLVSVNCCSLSENLIGSELFGHKRGSFTDAKDDRAGAFEAARGGTLFLDEIGDLPINLQPKLLRALENKEVRPIGSDTNINTDVRIIAATHQDLNQSILEGRFRKDLYFRLNILRLSPPPLRERMEDFDHLLYHFCRDYKISFTQKAIERLKKHQWPGNIRELKNVISRSAALVKGRSVTLSDLPFLLDLNTSFNNLSVDLNEINVQTLKEIEKQMVIAALVSSMGNQKVASIKLGMARTTLNDKVKSFNINIKEVIKKSLIWNIS